ncbi:MAG: sortase [Actinomycetota bacterium]|nr:sortase [Actinomycetota bacterium]
MCKEKRRCCLVVLFLLCIVGLAMPRTAASTLTAGDDGPRLVEVMPRQPDVVGRDMVVVLSFDRVMDEKSLREAVSFEPVVEFRLTGRGEYMVVPENLLEGGRDYRFRLEEGKTCDMQGRVLRDGVSFDFSTRNDLMTLEVPGMDFSGPVVEGNDPQGVAYMIGTGVGHYPGTGRPGGGNLVLMAHSSGLVNFPFNRLGELEEGSEFLLRYGGKLYRYTMKEGFVVRDDELWIIDNSSHPMLTIFVCCAENGEPSPTFHPPYRYVVRIILSQAYP